MRLVLWVVWKIMRKVPIWMVEPSSSMARLTMAPSTQVPLRGNVKNYP